MAKAAEAVKATEGEFTIQLEPHIVEWLHQQFNATIAMNGRDRMVATDKGTTKVRRTIENEIEGMIRRLYAISPERPAGGGSGPAGKFDSKSGAWE